MKNILLINACNLSKGGGSIILDSIIAALPNDVAGTIFLDSRYCNKSKELHPLNIVYVKPTILSRLKCELKLFKLANDDSKILCLGSLGPLLNSRGKVYLFIQNYYLISNISLANLRIRIRIRIYFERLWMRLSIKNVDQIIVQSNSMRLTLLESEIFRDKAVEVKPLVPSMPIESSGDKIPNRYDFIYVASGEPHKNHINLIKAFILLAKAKLYPSLCLVLNKNENIVLCNWIESQAAKYGINIIFISSVKRSDLFLLYLSSTALIFPSFIESFGLPLAEAVQAKIPVIASELDFVRDILDPVETFDPHSSVSIYRAILRFLNIVESKSQQINSVELLNFVLQN